MTNATAHAGRALAEILGLKVIGTEGHDLKCACPLCPSSDAGRVDGRTGAYYCFSCEKGLSGFDLAKIVLNDHKAAVQAMIGVGVFQDYMVEGNSKAHSPPSAVKPVVSDGRNSDGKAGEGGDLLAEIAAKKGCTVAGFKKYGGFVKGDRVMFPERDENCEICTLFEMSLENLKGKNFPNGANMGKAGRARGVGLFLPGRKPAPGETWILVEGVKDASVLSDLSYNAVGLPGNTLDLKDRQFGPLFDGVHTIPMPDLDLPSWGGALKTTNILKGHAASVRIARLPGMIEDSHGADVRDILEIHAGDGRGPGIIQDCVKNAEPPEKAFAWMGGGAGGPSRFTKVYTCPEFLALDLKADFLIRDILVAGQPAVIGGRSKALKTSIATDLVVSLGSGTPFLGKFRTQMVNVAFWSGESGAVVVRETALRIAKARGVALPDCSILWGFDLPKLSEPADLKAMAEVIKENKLQEIDKHELQVVVVDPLYLSLLSADTAGRSSDLFFMGTVLQPLTQLGQDTGCTFILIHHFRKNSQVDESEPAGLEELTQSGVAEWARQWILLQRISPYQADGHHEIWMRAGGSAGHASLWALNIKEGILDPDTFTGRTWEVAVQPAADARAEIKREKETRRAADLEKREGEYRDRLLTALRKTPDGDTARGLRPAARLNNDSFNRAISALIQEGRAEPCEITKNKRKFDGYRPTGK